MITWNTISRTSDDNVTQAIYLLETLSRDESIPILEFLRQKGGASFHEISQYFNGNALDLEQQLKELIEVGALVLLEKTTAAYYALNQGRLSTISRVAGRLNELRLEGIQKNESRK